MSIPPDAPSTTAFVPTDLLEGRYRLEAQIGRGGMGTVYRALDTRLNRPVAIKVLRDAEGADPARFESEVQTLARFIHPNLVRLLDAGEFEEQPYLVMDLVDGPTLGRRLSEGRLSSAETAVIGAGVASALAYVHESGIVHRDVKPANVLLDRDNRAHLADFGIARLVDTTGMTATGLTLGTPAYLAPEQVLGEEIGPAADVYALGLVLLECLSGRRAFEGTPSEITAARIQRDPTIPPELDEGWQEILEGMTARAPESRLTAAAVSEVLSDTGRFSRSNLASAAIPSSGETTAVMGGGPRDTTRILPAEATLDPTLVAPPRSSVSRGGRDRRYVIGLLIGLAIVGLVLGLAFGLSGPKTPPAAGHAPSKPATSTTSTSTTSTSSTTTTSTSTTTTTLPAPSVASAAGALVSSLDTGVTNGTVSPQADQQLVNGLQPLLVAGQPGQSSQQVQQYDQLVQQFDQDVQNGQITGAAVSSLTGPIDALATALGTTVPTASTVPAPGPPGGNGHGHGHGGGNGN